MIAAQTSRITKRLGKRLNFHLQSSISALSGFIPLICPTSPLGFLVDETRFPSQTRSLVRIVRRHETALSLSKASLALESLSSRSPVSLQSVFGQSSGRTAPAEPLNSLATFTCSNGETALELICDKLFFCYIKLPN